MRKVKNFKREKLLMSIRICARAMKVWAGGSRDRKEGSQLLRCASCLCAWKTTDQGGLEMPAGSSKS